jgi:hypothetical protein
MAAGSSTANRENARSRLTVPRGGEMGAAGNFLAIAQTTHSGVARHMASGPRCIWTRGGFCVGCAKIIAKES